MSLRYLFKNLWIEEKIPYFEHFYQRFLFFHRRSTFKCSFKYSWQLFFKKSKVLSLYILDDTVHDVYKGQLIRHLKQG